MWTWSWSYSMCSLQDTKTDAQKFMFFFNLNHKNKDLLIRSSIIHIIKHKILKTMHLHRFCIFALIARHFPYFYCHLQDQQISMVFWTWWTSSSTMNRPTNQTGKQVSNIYTYIYIYIYHILTVLQAIYSYYINIYTCSLLLEINKHNKWWKNQNENIAWMEIYSCQVKCKFHTCIANTLFVNHRVIDHTVPKTRW